jgi:biopolymer transport protein ExbB
VQDLTDLVVALRAGGIVIYPLLGLAVVAAVIIVEKGFVYLTRTHVPPALLRTIESAGFKWNELEQHLTELGAKSYAGRFLRLLVANRRQPSWWIESRAGDEASLIEKALGRWTWVLETIVTAAPLLGLLGTITGMIRSFRLFGDQGLLDPAGVTGGVAEALIATAVGLFIAVTALFAFNFFSQRRAQLMDELERLGTRLVDRIRLDEEGRFDEAP